jgi:hypothetical protein
MFPIDRYTGWKSFWPVATETVVLSDPRMIGINMEPWVDGSLAMVS